MAQVQIPVDGNDSLIIPLELTLVVILFFNRLCHYPTPVQNMTLPIIWVVTIQSLKSSPTSKWVR